jgi:hypothetical protein
MRDMQLPFGQAQTFCPRKAIRISHCFRGAEICGSAGLDGWMPLSNQGGQKLHRVAFFRGKIDGGILFVNGEPVFVYGHGQSPRVSVMPDEAGILVGKAVVGEYLARLQERNGRIFFAHAADMRGEGIPLLKIPDVMRFHHGDVFAADGQHSVKFLAKRITRHGYGRKAKAFLDEMQQRLAHNVFLGAAETFKFQSKESKIPETDRTFRHFETSRYIR